jgi:hypothetical protein
MSVRTAGTLSLLIATLAPKTGAGQRALPTLRYDPPPNFYRSASTPPDQYSSNAVNAYLVVYPFRTDPASLLQAYRQTMLRGWIDPQYQETNVAAQPLIDTGTMPGADTVIVWRFIENIAGLPRPHTRMAILARGAVAIVDLSANSDYSWRQAWPAMQVTLASMRVVMPSAVAATPDASPATRALAGLFVGTKPRYVVNLNRPVGSGDWVTAMHYYLFSGDGRVYRGYDLPQAPGGDVRRFDYEAASQADPDNSGTYAVQGNQLIIQLGGQQPERITTTVDPRRLVINTVVYLRQ